MNFRVNDRCKEPGDVRRLSFMTSGVFQRYEVKRSANISTAMSLVGAETEDFLTENDNIQRNIDNIKCI